MLIEISILSLNIWDIPFSSKNRKFRVVAICKEIVKGNYDVVLLQEIWSHSDLEYITNTTSNFFPFSHFFFSGVAGSGLAVLSKFPIIMTLFHAWRVNGYPHRIHHGDWFRGKGVGLCTIRVHNQEVNIYVAHLHAEYNTKYEDYKAHRVVQAFDTAQFIKSTRGNSVLQILAGDLKAEPDDLAYRLLLLPSKLIDVCDNSYGTSEYSTNSYASKKHLQNKERIDYIFYRSGNNYQAKVLKYELPFSHYIPNHQLHFSNHGAIACRIQVIKPSEKNEDLHDSGETCHSLREGVHVCEQHLKKIRSDKMYYLGMALVFATILFVCVDTNISYGFLIKKVNILFQKPTIRNVIKNSRIQNLINNPTIRSLFQILNFQQVYKPIQTLLRLIVSGLIIYFTFMATMWNSMEANGILSGKLAMETLLLNSHDL